MIQIGASWVDQPKLAHAHLTSIAYHGREQMTTLYAAEVIVLKLGVVWSISGSISFWACELMTVMVKPSFGRYPGKLEN